MKTGITAWCLLLLAACLLTALLSGRTLAQGEPIDLSLRLVSGEYHNKIKTDRDNLFFLEIRNTGKSALTNIRFSSEKPDGWVVEFKPGNVAYLSPGSMQTVDINIKPDANAGRGDHRITLIAEASEVRKVENIWVQVETPSYWLWIGGVLGAVLVAVFILVFLRYGRANS